MIRIYKGDVFSFDISEYNRKELLQMCWNLGKCENFKFLVYDGAVIIGAVTYENILYQDEVNLQTLDLTMDIFSNAREYFHSYTAREGDCIPVIDETGIFCLLEYKESKLFNLYGRGELNNEFSRLYTEYTGGGVFGLYLIGACQGLCLL